MRHNSASFGQFACATAAALALSSLLLAAGAESSNHVPSYVAWTSDTIAAASSGDAFRGSLVAKSCGHCHGEEGFSPAASSPNLAGMDKLATWKQLEDFRSHKRLSRAMGPVAESLSARDLADVTAYYSMLPLYSDPQDNRSFPQAQPNPNHASAASHLVTFGDGERGVPPCQTCHGPAAYRPGAPSLMNQNSDYLLSQMEGFACGNRANDINMTMRTISRLLTDDERHALAEFYGAGLGLQPTSSK